MSRDGVEAEYESFRVPPEVERAWLDALIAEQLASLDEAGNWRVLDFLLHHGLTQHVESVLDTEPLGDPSERTSYLEVLWKLVTPPFASVEPAIRDRVAHYVRGRAGLLLEEMRPRRSQSGGAGGPEDRVERLLAGLHAVHTEPDSTSS